MSDLRLKRMIAAAEQYAKLIDNLQRAERELRDDQDAVARLHYEFDKLLGDVDAAGCEVEDAWETFIEKLRDCMENRHVVKGLQKEADEAHAIMGREMADGMSSLQPPHSFPAREDA